MDLTNKNKLIKSMINQGFDTISPASGHTGFYFFKNEDFLFSYYYKDDRCYIAINNGESGKGRFIYTSDTKKIKALVFGLFDIKLS